MTIHSIAETISSLPCMGAGEKICEVAGRARGLLCMDGIGEVGDRASEDAIRVYGTGFASGSLAVS